MEPFKFVSAIEAGLNAEHEGMTFRKIAEKGRGLIADARYTGDTWHSTLPQRLYSDYESRTRQDYGLLAYFPKAMHANAFSKSAKKLPQGAYPKYFPGAVGIVHYLTFQETGLPEWEKKRPLKHHWTITAIQGCFSRDGLREIQRNLHREYPNWKEHLLRGVFEKARSENVPAVVLNFTPERDEDGQKIKDEKGRTIFKGKGNAEAFTKIADEMGYDVSSQWPHGKDSGLVAKRREL
ncbi:hypothetical protein HY994_00620 [Candidatus Micrarchaeota archaeon]|nr:hypothetical protein [Candidatus Micrarchaeota archaeon]